MGLQKEKSEGRCREDADKLPTRQMERTYRSGFHTTLLEFLKSWSMDFGRFDELELTLGADSALGFGRHGCRVPQLTCKEDEKGGTRGFLKKTSSSLKCVSNFPFPKESGQNVGPWHVHLPLPVRWKLPGREAANQSKAQHFHVQLIFYSKSNWLFSQ